MKITLNNNRKKYFERFNKFISLMTISRILRHKLKLHFLKTTPKNPIIKSNNYQIMLAIFIKAIVRCIKLGLKFIFVDETGFQLVNNNYYDWREYKEQVFGGAKNE